MHNNLFNHRRVTEGYEMFAVFVDTISVVIYYILQTIQGGKFLWF